MPPQGLSLLQPSAVPAPSTLSRVGVVVNASSRQVNERLLRLLPEVIPSDDLYVTHLAADIGLLARRLLERQYDTLFLGGGNRTFATLTSALLRHACASNRPLPRLGLLRLGQTQGLATLLRASGRGGRAGHLDDVLRARAGEVPGYRQLGLLEVDGTHALAAGMGLELLCGSSRGLAPGVVALEARVGRGGHALRLDASGRPVGDALEEGALLFRGKANIAAAAMVPHVLGDEGAFPCAGHPSHMHLRVGRRAGALRSLLPGHDAALYEFHATSIELRFERQVPLWLGPNGRAHRDTLHLAVHESPVEVCDFSHAFH
ncbi:MAG TPA: hypothetical protein VK013_15320 [Myxococcaceae bacterium]|nr:hypothetical protein [Myxococcaceae bacterium]